jgi:hypothetical protein
MQSVIGEYESFEDARQAVRSLERQQFSIQDMIIADQRPNARPQKELARDGGGTRDANFLVLMRGERLPIDRARALLRRALLEQ